MFFIKRSKIIVDCMTNNTSAFELAKPHHTRYYLPDWWKTCPRDYKESPCAIYSLPTMKSCTGFIELYKHGITFPLWSDLNVWVDKRGSPNYMWKFSDNSSEIETHDFVQLGNALSPTNVLHIKLINPWIFMTKKDIQWVFLEQSWNRMSEFRTKVLPGVASFKYQNSANINMFIERSDKEETFEFKFRDPIAQAIPLSEKKIILKHHLISDVEFAMKTRKNNTVSFKNRHLKVKQFLQNCY